MKRYLVATLTLFVLSPRSNFAQSIRAEDLRTQCAAQGMSEARATCALIIKVFMDGFIEGVGKGVLGVYTYDSEVRAAVESIPMKEMAPRISLVGERATCLKNVSVQALTAAFVEKMRTEPALREEPYREALTRTIVSQYCK